ncbi:MAG: CoB--CoM heterodisulfide reductase iron-sulfur subunit A family protein [Thermodesulfobacteriota bacterium]|nr:CoB--CoM heterodisulfide reductase iron-sulfur subunit A family protein [Thermodesulfobacteriota bacterium]
MFQKKEDPESEEIRVGVYICHCGVNIASTVDVESIQERIVQLPDVVVCRNYPYMCSDPGQKLVRDDIQEHNLDRIVVAACSPRMHEPTFRKTLEQAGLNPYCLEMANIREHCSWVHDDRTRATEKAFKLICAAVARASLLEPLEEREVEVRKSALVIGAGIAGIQAALDIADTGFQVYLVERDPSIGGHMAQLDKTFPTLDCSACILTPKMVEVERHPNIELLTYSEVIEVEGFMGNFKAKVRKKPRYIIMDRCISCGLCADACRLCGKIPSEFDEEMGKRSVPYIPFPYAVPSKYTIDPETCLYLTKGKCGETLKCKDACPADAIDFDQKEEIIEIDVGTIIVATGFDEFDVRKKPEFGYDLYDNVISAMEFERLVSSSGPTRGKIIVNEKEPKDVVFIQCVGSRDKSVGNEYCSRVCCMYTAKQAHLVHEKLPDAKLTIFYMDVRAFGKGFEEFYDRVRGEGVRYIRGNVSDVIKKEGRLLVMAEDTLLGEPIDVEADLVILATGIVPRHDVKEVQHMLKISQSPDGFFQEAHPKLRPVDTFSDGIFIAGCCQSPKDIPDTVAQAKGAASSAITKMARGKVKVEVTTASVDPFMCRGCGRCVDVCEYGASSLEEVEPGIFISRVNEFTCQGCGVCSVACPSGAVSMGHFKNEQIFSQIKEAI